ncbi:lipid asymmetry maintenance protein MlaB [Colwellia sp. RSH04]|uniref:STAS domain-containing protein n=1 Tax=Colwellia sp. RSH04 TaxID=2305464 RepID=UPI000E586622|nr:STAS domain-containing protein [Colwellia sp. RSH04]RHW76878.1 STAS domain-containing protein [Colwellia sp. RSH04]
MLEINLQISDHNAKFYGDLTRHTLLSISSDELDLLWANDYTLIDLSALNTVDTAGLAWLLYLLEQAQARSSRIEFTQLPAKLINLIQLSGVNGLLPIK